MLSALASEPQYFQTLAPIWHALGKPGDFLLPDHLWSLALAHGIEPAAWRSVSEVALVASYRDYRATSGPVILAEHGAGQSYAGRPESVAHPHYAGGDDRERVILFLCPGPHPAARNRAAYPDTPCVEIGNPRHDHWRRICRTDHEPTLAYAFHWGAGVCAEAGSAWYHWRDHLDLPSGYRLLGTGHPRAFQEMAGWYEAKGVIPVETFEAIVAEADILVADNTGVMYDWAALDRPVVALNDPTCWNRRIDHGLRFWDAIPGLDVDVPADLPGAIANADSRHARRLRARATRAVYTHLEGAAHIAADAIRSVLP